MGHRSIGRRSSRAPQSSNLKGFAGTRYPTFGAPGRGAPELSLPSTRSPSTPRFALMADNAPPDLAADANAGARGIQPLAPALRQVLTRYNSNSCHFRLCVMLFPRLLGFCLLFCILFMSCISSHGIMCISFVFVFVSCIQSFPRCSFRNLTLPHAPAAPLKFVKVPDFVSVFKPLLIAVKIPGIVSVLKPLSDPSKSRRIPTE